MNLFILHQDPVTAAQYNCDKHVSKIILESCQILASAHIYAADNGINTTSYYPLYLTNSFKGYKHHYNNKVTKWARESLGNYQWCAEHAVALCDEFKYRRNKSHAWHNIANWFRNNPPSFTGNITPFVQAVIHHYHDPVFSYYMYYINSKPFATWSKRNVPELLGYYGSLMWEIDR